MARAKPKHGSVLFYWDQQARREDDSSPIPRLDKDTRAEIGRQLKKASSEFFDALEVAILNFLNRNKLRETTPSYGSVKASLAELEKGSKKLLKNVNQIDSHTRSMIGQMWFLEGNQGRVMDDSEKALMDLWAAVKLTQSAMKPKAKKGRPIDAKHEFVVELFQIFKRFGCKPKVTKEGPFEKCLGLILAAAGEHTGADNIHELAKNVPKLG